MTFWPAIVFCTKCGECHWLATLTDSENGKLKKGPGGPLDGLLEFLPARYFSDFGLKASGQVRIGGPR